MKEVKLTIENAKAMKDSGIESLVEFAKANYPELFEEEKKWEDFGPIEGYCITNESNILICDKYVARNSDKNVHPTEKEALSTLALSQLRQWRDKANGEKLCDWADWEDIANKYCLTMFDNRIHKTNLHYSFSELAFKTEEIRDQFLKDHKTLIRQYFMLD